MKRAAGSRTAKEAVTTSAPLSIAGLAHITLIGAGVIAILIGLWWTRTAILLLFAGILLAILLDGAARSVTRWTGLPKSAALAAVIAVIGLGLVALGWSTGPALLGEGEQLAQRITNTVAEFTTKETAHGIQAELDWTKLLQLLPSPLGIAMGATAVASGVLDALASTLIVLFFGIYLAVDPATYLRIATRAAPQSKREAISTSLSEIGASLHRWLKAQLLAMALVGSMTYAGLLMLGMPLAFVLALLLGMSEFVPYIGPILGLVPMLIVAAGQDLTMVYWVLGLYGIVQFLESYVISPLLQSRAVQLPPVLVILSQLVLGAVFGVLGLALATPLLAVAAVPFRRAVGDERNAVGKRPRAHRTLVTRSDFL